MADCNIDDQDNGNPITMPMQDGDGVPDNGGLEDDHTSGEQAARPLFRCQAVLVTEEAGAGGVVGDAENGDEADLLMQETSQETSQDGAGPSSAGCAQTQQTGVVVTLAETEAVSALPCHQACYMSAAASGVTLADELKCAGRKVSKGCYGARERNQGWEIAVSS